MIIKYKRKDQERRESFSKHEKKRLFLKYISYQLGQSKGIQDPLWKVWSAAYLSLHKDHSVTRIRNRCLLTHRGRGNLSQFQLSRLSFRSLASKGMIPGVQKASW